MTLSLADFSTQLTGSSSGSGTAGSGGGSLSGAGGKSNTSLVVLEPALPFSGSVGGGGSTVGIVGEIVSKLLLVFCLGVSVPVYVGLHVL